MVDIKTDNKKSSSTKQTKTKEKDKNTPEKSETGFKSGSIAYASGQLMIPPGVQSKLSAIGAQYGVPFDLSNISVGDGTMAEKVKALRVIVDMITNDSKLLPEMMKLIKKLMQGDLKLAKFHAGLVKEATKHQLKLDKQVADIALTMAGYQVKSERRELKTNKRLQVIERRGAAYNEYYEDSVFGAEMKLIDLEIETKTVNQAALSASKQEQIKFDSERKQKSIEYVRSAIGD